MECINGVGRDIPPMLILTGTQQLAPWFINDLDDNIAVTTTETRFPNDWILLQWVEHFEKFSAIHQKSAWHLLLMDGYGSHHTYVFLRYTLIQGMQMHTNLLFLILILVLVTFSIVVLRIMRARWRWVLRRTTVVEFGFSYSTTATTTEKKKWAWLTPWPSISKLNRIGLRREPIRFKHLAAVWWRVNPISLKMETWIMGKTWRSGIRKCRWFWLDPLVD